MNYYNEIKTKLIENENYARIKDYSRKLTEELNIKYSPRTLYKILKLYKYLTNKKVPTLSAKLSWSHYIILMTLIDTNKIGYYLRITQNLNLSKRELEERIKNKEHERLDKTIGMIICKVT